MDVSDCLKCALAYSFKLLRPSPWPRLATQSFDSVAAPVLKQLRACCPAAFACRRALQLGYVQSSFEDDPIRLLDEPVAEGPCDRCGEPLCFSVRCTTIPFPLFISAFSFCLFL